MFPETSINTTRNMGNLIQCPAWYHPGYEPLQDSCEFEFPVPWDFNKLYGRTVRCPLRYSWKPCTQDLKLDSNFLGKIGAISKKVKYVNLGRGKCFRSHGADMSFAPSRQHLRHSCYSRDFRSCSTSLLAWGIIIFVRYGTGVFLKRQAWIWPIQPIYTNTARIPNMFCTPN